MFICQLTGIQSQAGESAKKLVTQIRSKVYTRRNFKTGQDEEIGRGTEIIKELLITEETYNKLMAEGFQPELVVEKPRSFFRS